jgi:hypothetical protein
VPDARGQLWNIGPAHDHWRTVLDDLPTPTDQMLPDVSACPLRTRSDCKQGKLTVTPGEADTGRPSRDEPARQVQADDLLSN